MILAGIPPIQFFAQKRAEIQRGAKEIIDESKDKEKKINKIKKGANILIEKWQQLCDTDDKGRQVLIFKREVCIQGIFLPTYNIFI